MFDLDRWREIFQSIQKNKLRSVMSGFTVAFAILLFTLLFGIVSGLSNSFKSAFKDDAQNFMKIRSWKTSKPYKGLQTGRKIRLSNNEYNYVTTEYDKKIQFQSARINKNLTIKYKNNADRYGVVGVHPEHQFLEKTIIDEGRFLNEIDLKEHQKVIVIGRLLKKDLFGEKIALGKRLNVSGSSFLIVGVFSDDGGDREERVAYVPITTIQKMYGNNDYVSQIILGFNPDLNTDEAIAFGNKLEKDLRNKMSVHPNDQSALSVRNMAKANQKVNSFMFVLYLIVIVVGSGTLVAGIIGISNIMIFVIKERTKEFGIRKALGATPKSIVAMVVQESVLITTLAGYLGLSLGTFILTQIGDGLEDYFIKDPSVSPVIVFGATVVLIFSGLIAGYIPAKKAANIKPIEALRAD